MSINAYKQVEMAWATGGTMSMYLNILSKDIY